MHTLMYDECAEVNIFLYKMCVLPHMKYGYPVWSTVKSIQPLGAMDKSNADSIDILVQVLLLNIKLDSNLVTAFLNILRKPQTQHASQPMSTG